MFKVGIYPDVKPDVSLALESERPVSVALRDEKGKTRITMFLTEGQSDSLFHQLGEAAKQIERAKG